MGKWKRRGTHVWVAIGSAVLLIMGIAIPAMAANAVSIEVTGEDPEAALQSNASAEIGIAALGWTAYIDDLALPSVQASRSNQTSKGTLKLTVDASGAGNRSWTVTVQSSAFA